MDTQESFAPQPKGTRQVPTGTVSAALAVALGNQVRLIASGADCRVEFGKDNTVTATKPSADGATAGSALLKAGSVEVFSVPLNTAFIAYATDANSGTLELTPGIGL
ncbi:hypothetical protein ASF58_23220 [Methylobacterium sp. Leaf125]|uniref:hypothetical protein n=1 Tax=Methylobacterium sp. Leaf125 TaxID=1736265 RepID=UPI00070206A7|nr:hypothetical protein [Methylobacterium sp. Leaf125]KQQ39054.1 hypothetical protein ASF58_23220 [Methylobacterium sp. Leaf125]